MNFAELYAANKHDAEQKIATLWCSEANTDSQRAEIKKIQEKVSDLFAPESAVPVVQCMNSYKSVHSVTVDEAKKLVGTLWTSSSAPYEHQYQSWKTLLKDSPSDKPMSICVTTGTGSGKTECFMMPLVQDLLQFKKQNDVEGKIQALFLYPLNALMEDQKERLEEMLKGTGLTYTVYNGDLPEDMPSIKSPDYEAEMRKINQIRGLITDDEGNPIDENGNVITDPNKYRYKYPSMVFTRKMVRSKKTCPNILLTNPTMLEYILLRKNDETLIDPKAKTLRWVAIDETHTYTGAGAAELAMLLRRVMIAFGMKAPEIRFATSSATFANVDQSLPEDERKQQEKEAEDKLRNFISDLTGTTFEQVRVIGGVREGEEVLAKADLPDGDKAIWRQLCKADYIALDELFTAGSIEQKLKALDEMCHRIESLQKTPKDKLLMKAKVHYFYRVPNSGLYVRLNNTDQGAFNIYTDKPNEPEQDKLPLLELSRCKNCGEFVATGLLDRNENKLYALESDDTDMFDLGMDDADDSQNVKQVVFALSNKEIEDEDHTGVYEVGNGNEVVPANSKNHYRPGTWRLIGNTYKECPCCRTKLTRYVSENKDEKSDAEVQTQDMRLQKLRLSAEFVSRILAPSILDQLEEGKSKKNALTLHKGQQFLSFVDSRQAAAKSTLNQNLEQERLWFYSTIFHELCRRNQGLTVQDALKMLNEKSLDPNAAMLERMSAMKMAMELQTPGTTNARIAEILRLLNPSGVAVLRWDEIADLLYNDEKFIVFCQQFVKRTEDSEDLDPHTGAILEKAKKKYLYSIMVLYLGNHPASAASPETMGLFHPVYPFLEGLKAPKSVEAYNALIQNPDNKIGDTDWQNLIQIFIDYTVRSNQSFFLNMKNEQMIDIFACERYATEKPRRRPVTKPKYEKRGDISDSRIVRYLSGLIARDRNIDDDKQIQIQQFDEIAAVVNDLWTVLTNEILEVGTHYEEGLDKQVDDKDTTALRLNLAKMCFKLYDEVYLCDTNTDGKKQHAERLRPIEVNFKKFSPYLIGNRAVTLKDSLHEIWSPYKLIETGDAKADYEALQEWAVKNRAILWNDRYMLWGETGVFADRLNNIYLKPDLFIQAEHTAQVDKVVARTLQAEFKDHTINVLACSTTMEMGVDLGNLEVVMLTSVPPQPANYKQRAGRSGRNNKVKSVCITLCSSDAIGLRTLTKPIETIISRPVDVPMVDLGSNQVVIRHIISYLIRTFGVFAAGENGGKIGQKVLDFYTSFETQKAKGDIPRYYNADGNEIGVVDGLGEFTCTKCESFDKACTKPLTQQMKDDLAYLLNKTSYANDISKVLPLARKENQRCYDELSEKIELLKDALKNADKNGKGYGSYLILLKMEYLEILKQKLLTYWATNRFTPNANMPVNVMSLDLNASRLGKKKKDFNHRGSSNPSYTMKEAIQQYVPGNSIVVDGVVYVVRGLSTSDEYTDNRTYKQLYRNASMTVVGNDPTLGNRIPWNVNGQEGVTLVQPAKYLPDPNEDYSRVQDDNIYTRVSSQLIGAADWENKVSGPFLFSTRRNQNAGNANILYYNEGIGYGYAMCTKCGKMTLEYAQVDDKDAAIPREIDDRKNTTKGTRYHYAIDREPKSQCFASKDKSLIKRNVIIGDLMQTDYCEIRLCHKGDTSWISYSTNKETDNQNRNLLITLGIVFCQALVELKGWDRNAVDFAVMQNRHLCIFDTNPGGAGYSVALHDNQTMLEVIKLSKSILTRADKAGSKDMLLDKFTLRYLRNIDIQAALDWIKEQDSTKGILPDPIPAVFTPADVMTSSLRELLKKLDESSTHRTIFVDDYFNSWDFGAIGEGWQGRFLCDLFNHRADTTFCVVGKPDAIIPEPILQMLRDLEFVFGKTKIVKNPWNENIRPLAYVDGHLYFTIEKEYSTLNESWGDGVLYCTKTENPVKRALDIDTSIRSNTKIFQLTTSEFVAPIKTRDLGKILQEKSGGIIDSFIDHCKQSNGAIIQVEYQDEHLKSVLGMVLTMQTIGHIVKQIGNDFGLTFHMEQYYDPKGKSGVEGNIPASYDRDDKLDELCNQWLDDIASEAYGNLDSIDTRASGSLTHWRVLSLTCNGKKLSIFPDGGFINGWHLARNPRIYNQNNTTTRENINIILQNDIKYDVMIENL